MSSESAGSIVHEHPISCINSYNPHAEISPPAVSLPASGSYAGSSNQANIPTGVVEFSQQQAEKIRRPLQRFASEDTGDDVSMADLCALTTSATIAPIEQVKYLSQVSYDVNIRSGA